MKKILMIILDGLGDRPNVSLNGRTALQAAYRPNMNSLASRGMNGLMAPVGEGVRVGSDTSHLSLLGYNPLEVYTGRGPFEAMGLGMSVKSGDVAFRANFSTRDASQIITDRRAGRLTNGTDRLAKSLNMEIDGVRFFVQEGVEHRAALVVRGQGLSDRITDSDPHIIGVKANRVEALSPEADYTASVINKFLDKSRKILEDHEVNRERASKGLPLANELLIRGPGTAPSLRPFSEKYGMSGAYVVGIPMIAGICDLAGMEAIKFKGATGRVDTDYYGKVGAAIKSLGDHDFVLLNIKATDIAGHDGDPELKRDVVEKIDHAFEQLNEITGSTVIAITGDHSTPCSTKDHSGDPVPVLIVTDGIRRDCVNFYDEVSASKGALRITSNDLMTYLMQISDRSEKYGA